MSAFLLFVKLRLREVFGHRSALLVHFGLPVALLVGTGMIFMEGPPYERRNVCVVTGDDTAGATLVADPSAASSGAARAGSDAAEASASAPGASARPEMDAERLIAELAGVSGLRVQTAPSREVALRKLGAHAVSAVVVLEPSPSVIVGPQDGLLGRGLQSCIEERTAEGRRGRDASTALSVAEVPRWGFVHYLFPGMLVWTIITEGFLGMSYLLVHYRQNGFLRKLAVTPLPRMSFVGAQIVARSVLVLGQLALLVGVAWCFFGLPLTATGALWLMSLTLLGLLTFTGAGFALACFIRSEVNLTDVVSAVMVPVVLLSEIFFSAEELPDALGAVASMLPSTQLVRLIRGLVLYGESDPVTLLQGGAILAGWGIATFAVSVALFRWHET